MSNQALPIAQPAGSVELFGGRLNINKKRDITAVLPGTQALGLLSGDKFMRNVEGERSTIMQKNMPVTAPPPSERGVPGLFNDMGYHASVSDAPNAPRRTIPTSISNTEPQTNVRTPIMRILHAPHTGSMQDLPSRNELVFLKKTRETDTVNFMLGRSAKNYSKLESYMPSDATINVNTRPMLGLNCVALAEYATQQLQQMAQKNTARHRQLTVREFFYGVPDLPWTGWTLDSAVTLEMDDGSHGTAVGDQYSSSSYGNNILRPGFNNEMKVLTCGLAGQHELVDYWGSRGVQEGASLWIVAKKYDPTVRNPSKKAMTFVKSRKSRVLELALNSAMASVPIINMPPAVMKDVPVFALGFFFVANPTGGEIDPSIAEYKNEYGDTHMGVIMPVGRVLFLPPHFKQAQPPIMMGDSEFLCPFTDSTEVMIREHLTVLLHTNKDGVLGHY